MKTATLLAFVPACLALVAPVQKRQVGGVLICNGANATGHCDYEVYKMDTCYNMTSEFYQNAATFAPDAEAFYCYPYIMRCGEICTSPTGCTFGAVSSNYANKNDLGAIGWDKLISSFECHLNQTTSSKH